MNNEIRECPFCGELPVLKEDCPCRELLILSCENVNCEIHPYKVGKTKKEVVSAWNTRAESEPRRLTLDELRECERKWIETRGNQWVWIQVLKNAYMPYQKYTGWLCVIKRFADDVCNFGTHLGGTSVAFDEAEYGKTWFAYDREVKGEEINVLL